MTSSGLRKDLQDLAIGEKILSVDSSGQLVFSEVLLFLDYDPGQKREFLEITLLSGRSLQVTPTHLVVTGEVTSSRTVFAKELKIGDSLLVSDSNHHRLIEDVIVKVREVLRTGVYAPLTSTGTLIVNDVVASCYATVDSQSLAHWAFAPVRLVLNVSRGFRRLWILISSPMVGWTQTPIARHEDRPGVGVFWYARALYTAADYLLPSHMNE